jgi:hypothetical protein
METLYANISGVAGFLHVCNYNPYQYHVKNVSGLQYCFKGLILDDTCRNYSNMYEVGLMFPIRLFLGKKEGDQVKLSYSYEKFSFISGDQELIEFNLIVTCTSKFDTFENDLYIRSSRMDYYCNFNVNKNLQNLIAYNTHVDYCKSLNRPVKMMLKSYEPLLLADYIDIGNQDVLSLIKPIYNDLFIHQIPQKI